MTTESIEIESPITKANARRWPSQALLLLILFVAMILRLDGITERSFWYDESYTVHIAGDDWSKIIGDVVFYENTPPLHYLLLKPLVSLFGANEWSLRLPSAIFGVISVWLLYRLASNFVGQRESLIAAALLSVSQYHIYYSQEARAYTLMFALGLWSCDEFVRLMDETTPSSRRELRYCIATILSLYSHVYGFIPIAIQWVWYAMRYLNRPAPSFGFKRFLKTQLAIGLVFAPWVPILAYQYQRRAHRFWIPPMTGDEIPVSYGAYSAWNSDLAICLCAALVVIGASRLDIRKSLPALATLLLLPVVAPVLASMITHPLFVPRYGMLAIAGLFILVAAGIAILPVLLSWALVILLAVPLYRAPIPERTQPYREIGQFLDANMESGDLLVIDSYEHLFACKHYVHRTDVTIKGLRSGSIPIGLPLPQGMHHVWLVLAAPLFEPDEHSIRSAGNWRVSGIKWIKNIPILKLSQDEGDSAAATNPSTSPG